MATLEIKSPNGQVRTVELTRSSYVLGRDAGCELAFSEDGGLSRQHFSISQATGPTSGGWVVTDLKSRNGTFVNGERLQVARTLERGDSIKASRLQITYREAAGSAVVFEKADSVPDPGRATVMVNLKDLLGAAGTGTHSTSGPQARQWSSPVQALLRAGRELVSGRPLPDLFRVILDMAIEASGAERGVLMTIEDGVLVEQVKSQGEFRISSMVRDRVIEHRESLLIHDVLGDSMLQNRQSIVLQNVHTLMAVPLQTEDRVIGLIYVDSRSLFRPFVPDDLNLLTVMANVAAIRIERQRLAQIEEAEEHHRMELEQAASIQRLSLPLKAPAIPGFGVEGISVPCFSVGGDYYDYFKLPDGRSMIVIGDVAGKGMPAALLVMSTQAHASALSLTGIATDPGAFVTQLNNAIIPRCPGDRFISFFAVLVDPASDEIVYCNAGHNPPLLIRTKGETERLGSNGPVLGIIPVEYSSGTARLGQGDQLLLYTDGITEAESPAEEEFEVPNLERVLRESAELTPGELLNTILCRVDEWTKGAPASDDRTMVTIRRN
jgi:serine phosphatase RsbU (regulator of sigma subunit)/pSer/pThr/pTyr-binding forkhead associated (FHA) protein